MYVKYNFPVTEMRHELLELFKLKNQKKKKKQEKNEVERAVL